MRNATSKVILGLASLLTLVVVATAADAEPVKCQRAILNASGRFAQAEMKALVKCEKAKLQGKLGSGTDCHSEPKVVAQTAKAALKLEKSVARDCGGLDHDCATTGDGNDAPASIAWPSACPDFQSTGCTNPIASCGDIIDCLECVDDAAVTQDVSLYFDAAAPSSAGSGVNRCQIAIGAAASKFFAAKITALDRCWDARYQGQHANACPSYGDGKAMLAILLAEGKAIASIRKACDGLAPSGIGFVAQCPAVSVPGGSTCGGPITDVSSLTGCVDCVSEFGVDCAVTLTVPTFQSYSAECVTAPPAPTPTSTATATPTPTVSPTPTTTASPTPVINKCLAAKMKAEGNAALADLKCHAKAALRGEATDPNCLAKAGVKMVATFSKLDTKGGCITSGDGPSRDADTLNFAAAIDGTVGHAGKCDSDKSRAVGKYVQATMACYAAAAGRSGIVNATCLSKVNAKLVTAINKADTQPACSNLGQLMPLIDASGAFVADQICFLSPGDPSCVVILPTPTPTLTATTLPPTPTVTPMPGGCGNGVLDAGEDCDLSAGVTCQAGSNTSAAFACNPITCQCACPTTVTFAGDPTDPASILDTGWTGISHRAPIISNGEVTVSLTGCAGSSRPCGQCNVIGPIANPQAGAGQIDNRRCTNDTAIRCTTNTPCTAVVGKCSGGTNPEASCVVSTCAAPGGCTGGTCVGGPNAGQTCCQGGDCRPAGTCGFIFGSYLPLAAGGISTCVGNVFNGTITGTANVETGSAVNTALLASTVYLAASVDAPCSKCVGDPTINDGLLGGTCDTGPRAGLTCDANGTVPSRPDFGQTSLDCPSPLGSKIALLGINLSNQTSTVTRTLTVNSPNCVGQAGNKCLCGTCNQGVNPLTCFTNADCPDPDGAGPFTGRCNGNRCLGGPNAGAPCNNNSVCPSSSCTTPGEPTKPASCVDDTSNSVLDCADGADGTVGDQEGGCTVGPVDSNCTVASGHGQRGCLSDADCGNGPSSCATAQRKCFLTGGGTFQPGTPLGGTDTLIAVGMADIPMNDVASPTLASIFCVAPTGSASVNNVAGLPGPGRVTIRGTATGLP